MDREHPPRMPLTDNAGHITREWWLWLSDMFEQVSENTANSQDMDSATLALAERIETLELTDADEPQQPVSEAEAVDHEDVRAIAEYALQQARAALALLPVGIIVSWNGAISAIPDGWALCDGNNGTPDLRGLVLLGADSDSGGTYNVDDTGGATTDTSGAPSATTVVDNNADASTVSVGSAAHTHEVEIMQPWHAKAWIMRVA